jgi:hypothetical protein
MKYIFLICVLFVLFIMASNFFKEEKTLPHQAKGRASVVQKSIDKDPVGWAVYKTAVFWKNFKKKYNHYFNRLNYEFSGVLKTDTYKKGTDGFAQEYQPSFATKPEKRKKNLFP